MTSQLSSLLFYFLNITTFSPLSSNKGKQSFMWSLSTVPFFDLTKKVCSISEVLINTAPGKIVIKEGIYCIFNLLFIWSRMLFWFIQKCNRVVKESFWWRICWQLNFYKAIKWWIPDYWKVLYCPIGRWSETDSFTIQKF